MKKIFMNFSLGIVLLVSILTGESLRAQNTSDAQRIPILNYHVVTAGKVYRGARPLAEGLSFLRTTIAKGGPRIRTDIDLQGGDLITDDVVIKAYVKKREPGESANSIAEEKSQAEALGMNFVHVPIHSMTMIDEAEGEAISQAISIMANPQMQPVYVHCEHGNDRTGLVIALYRVNVERILPEVAYVEMRAMGHTGTTDILYTNAMDRYFFEQTKWMPTRKWLRQRGIDSSVLNKMSRENE